MNELVQKMVLCVLIRGSLYSCVIHKRFYKVRCKIIGKNVGFSLIRMLQPIDLSHFLLEREIKIELHSGLTTEKTSVAIHFQELLSNAPKHVCRNFIEFSNLALDPTRQLT